MTMIILVLVVIGLVVLEKKWALIASRSIKTYNGCQAVLVEPGEQVVWNATVENHGRLPVPFVRMTQNFPDEVQVEENELWRKRDWRKNTFSGFCEYRMTVKARRSTTRSIKMSLTKRGAYYLGSYQLNIGDLLGFREVGHFEDGKKIVVMPRHSAQRTAVDAVGGFLGDVSVRRFILEDPVLTVGFRDYTGREPMRAISWTRTAQSGTLQVKQYDHTAERHVVVLLNIEDADEAQFEECLSLARSVCEKLEQHKIPYGFRTNGYLPGPLGNVSSLMEGLGQQHLNTILYGLGGAERTCFYSFKYLTRQTLKKRKMSESYIVITPSDTGSAHSCIQELSNAVGHGICVLRGCEGVEKI